MSESASYISFCNCKATAREISSPPGVCLTIPFPLLFPFPFPFSIAFPFSFAFPFLFPFPSSVPFSFLVFISPHCMSSSPSPSSLLMPSRGQLLPPLGAQESAQFWSSSPLSFISSQFSGPTARKLPGLYWQQLGGSIFALRSSLPYQEKRSLVHLTFPELVFRWLERSTWSLKAQGLSHLHLFIWLWFFPQHLPHIWVEACSPLPKRQTAAPAVRPR